MLASPDALKPGSMFDSVAFDPLGDGLVKIAVRNLVSSEPRRFYRLNVKLLP